MRKTAFKVAFVVNHAAFFVSHRLPIAQELLRLGHEVVLITGRAGSAEMEAPALSQLQKWGIRHRVTNFGSSSINPLAEIRGLFGVVKWTRNERPDIIHCVSPKGIVFGGLAARLLRVPGVVFAISGMGYAFTDQGRRSLGRALIAKVIRVVFGFTLGHPNKKVIVQNKDDQLQFSNLKSVQYDDIVLIRGSGVNLERITNQKAQNKENVIVFPARLLIDKGVMEFVSAARILKEKLPDWRFILAGAAGYDNPSAISIEQASAWRDEGAIEWEGHVSNIDALMSRASIVCLPSYREGMPKALLEAAAAGCATVTTDVPGCREAITPGVTGELVPARDSTRLVEVLERLCLDKKLREYYGTNGRRLARDHFGLDRVVQSTIDVYSAILDRDRAACK